MCNQIGKFSVSLNLIESVEIIAEILSKLKFVPIKTEIIECKKCVEHTGHSPKFRKIEEGEVIPTYEIIAKKNSHGTITAVTVKEMKK